MAGRSGPFLRMRSFDSEPASEEEVRYRRWRDHALRGGRPDEVMLREERLRADTDRLKTSGLAPEEAFFVALRRLGAGHAATRSFARENSDLIWGQAPTVAKGTGKPNELWVAIALAACAGMAIKAPTIFGVPPAIHGDFYARNFAVLTLPFLSAILWWRRGCVRGTGAGIAVAFVVAAALMNLPAFRPPEALVPLTGLHLPIALWLLVGVVHAGERWRDTEARMDFVRFSGEFLIHGVLIALGGGVLIACVTGIFRTIGLDIRPFIGSWLAPCGIAGAIVVAGWLADGRRGFAGGMAPLLAQIFTPLFAAVIVVFIATTVITGRGIAADRDMLIGFDVLLAVVVGLLLYTAASRDPRSPPGFFDLLQLVLVVSALVVDLLALRAIGSRIQDFGFSPNRVAVLGENLILLVNLAWSAYLQIRFLAGRGSFSALERWQTLLLPWYAAWAAWVAAVLPIIFR